MSALAPTVTLAHGAAMPVLGLGTWPLDDAAAEAAVAEAIGCGYRLIDTAYAYRNETGVGAGLRASGVPREEVFLTSKFNRESHSVEGVAQAFHASAARLGVDYLDLLLIHWPNPGQDRYVEAWEGLGRLLADGFVRAIGLSNFKPAHIDRLRAETGIAADVNQVELNPWVTRDAVRAYDAAQGIVTQSWSPLGRAGDLLAEPAITTVAERLGRTPAQVVLRWHLDLGLTAVPKSADPRRMRENLAVFDFVLEPDDVAALCALDRGEAAAVDSDDFGH